MKETRKNVDALMEFIRNLTPAQKDKLEERLHLVKLCAVITNNQAEFVTGMLQRVSGHEMA